MSSQLILASAQGQLRHTTGKWENELLGIVIWLNFMHMTPMTQIALQTTATTKTTTATENVCNVWIWQTTTQPEPEKEEDQEKEEQ